ncbi:FkbM family methyltransferase [bacterium]|nr:FkbM family methyltransferase [bacterium]
MNEIAEDPDFAASGPGATLKERGLGFVDVGVRGGVHPVVEPIARRTTVLAFEPDLPECERLRARYAGSTEWGEVSIEPAALAGQEGRATLHRCSASTNDSLRPINLPFAHRYRMEKFEPTGETEVSATTLDRVLARFPGKPQHGEFLKLDTQATEFEVFLGARETLSKRTVALLVEVWYCQPYEGQKLFSDIELMLRSLGFSFYGASVHHRSRKLMEKKREVTRERPLWADAVFLKDPLAGGPVPVSLDARGLHVLFVCSTLLGFHDFALELALESWAAGAERARIERFVRRRAALPRWKSVLSALGLAARVLANPFRANITLGKFIDERRDGTSYEEIV